MGYYLNDEVVNSKEYKDIESDFNAEEYRQAWLKIPFEERTASLLIPGNENEEHDYLLELNWRPGKKASTEDFLKFLYLRRNSRLVFTICPECHKFNSVSHIGKVTASACHDCKIVEVTSSGLFSLIGKPQDACDLEYADILGVKTWNEYYIKNNILLGKNYRCTDNKKYNLVYDDIFNGFDIKNDLEEVKSNCSKESISEIKSAWNNVRNSMLKVEKTGLSKKGIAFFTT